MTFRVLGLRVGCWACGTPTWAYDSEEWREHVGSPEHLAVLAELGLTASSDARWERP